MGVTTTKTNKPLNPRGNDQSPLAYNRAKLYSGKALDFDGVNDYVDAGTLDITGYSAISIATYFNTDSNSTTQIAISLEHTAAEDIRFGVSAGDIFCAVDDGTLYQITEPVNANEWYFVVWTFDGSTLKGYLNGQEFDSISASFDFSTADGELNIGRRIDNSLYYNGELSNTKIFNTALTAAQVADLYNNPEKVVPTGVDNTALKLWLPMMEGAGTTAYDGSGNGNHGTISGATYVNGVGAPVAQSAVIDWNKGTNLLPESNGFVEADLNFVYTNSSETGATITAPDGSTDAFEYICDAITTNNQFVRINPNTTYTSGQVYTYSLFVKYNTKQFVKLAYINYSGNNYFVAAFDLINGTITDTNSAGTAANTNSFIEEAPNGWYRIGISASLTSSAAMNFEFNVIPSGTPTWSTYGRVDQTTTTSDKVYIYGASLIEGEQGPYVHTIGTAQPTPVLLPQGLTTGRDITGVNLFENVRKQGALNLDGNSWAEVHDNASLDITDAITLEAWVKWDASQNNKGILGRYLTSGANRSTMLVHHVLGVLRFYTSADGSSTNFVTNTQTLTDGEWYHIVGTSDGTTNKIYVNAQTPNTNTGSSIIAVNIPLEIGRYNQDPNYSYQQPIAQPRIYNRALTAEEVLRNYNSGKNTYK